MSSLQLCTPRAARSPSLCPRPQTCPALPHGSQTPPSVPATSGRETTELFCQIVVGGGGGKKACDPSLLLPSGAFQIPDTVGTVVGSLQNIHDLSLCRCSSAGFGVGRERRCFVCGEMRNAFQPSNSVIPTPSAKKFCLLLQPAKKLS